MRGYTSSIRHVDSAMFVRAYTAARRFTDEAKRLSHFLGAKYWLSEQVVFLETLDVTHGNMFYFLEKVDRKSLKANPKSTPAAVVKAMKAAFEGNGVSLQPLNVDG